MNDPKTIFEPLAGYALDLFSKLRGRPFVPHSLTKLQNLKVCRDLSKATTAIEVGSFKGVTTRRLSYLFEQVISIEIDTELHRQAKIRCFDRKNVEMLEGDAIDLLPSVIARTKNVLLFLDGHFSGGQTGQGDEPEPILNEIDLILADIESVSAIVFDDFRLFGVEPGWPKKSEVLQKLESAFPQLTWTITIQFDQFLVIRRF